jgi:alpha-1,3-mannosyltransferase
LRILHVTKRFRPYSGGVERYVEDLATRQCANGHSLVILTQNRDLVTGIPGRLATSERFGGLGVERVPVVGNARKQFPVGRYARVVQLFRWADVVHIHDPRFLFETSVALRLLTGTPLIFHTHGLIFHTSRFRWLKRLAQRIYYGPLLSHCVDMTIAGSDGDASLLTTYGGPPGGRLAVIPNAVDLTRYLELPDRTDQNLILSFGRIDTHKGLATLLEAVHTISRPWRLVVVGSGPAPLVAELKAKAQTLGIASRVEWAGRVDDATLLGLLGRAAVAVFPSTFEGFGLALLEALAAGRVVIANDLPTHRQILGTSLADSITNFGSTAASGAIENALSLTPDQRSRLTSTGRERARLFDEQSLCQQIDDVYEQLSITR